MISKTLTEKIKIKCYITDSSNETTVRINDIISEALTKVRRLIGVKADFDFELEGNEEELELLKNYCWYAWNDSSNEFKNNYLDDINSLHHKHEVDQYEEENE